ncbi:MAG: hypothetical protein GY935_11330 [Gammaproteobacteria bacterium]|nr:hypothetical protein [Gammaproteobacteria bacterium]
MKSAEIKHEVAGGGTGSVPMTVAGVCAQLFGWRGMIESNVPLRADEMPMEVQYRRYYRTDYSAL